METDKRHLGDLTLCFWSDDEVLFYPKCEEDAEIMGAKFLHLCQMIVNNPELAFHAFCEGGEKHV